MNATERQFQTSSKTFVSDKETFETTSHVDIFLSSAEQKTEVFQLLPTYNYSFLVTAKKDFIAQIAIRNGVGAM